MALLRDYATLIWCANFRMRTNKLKAVIYLAAVFAVAPVLEVGALDSCVNPPPCFGLTTDPTL